MKAFGNYSRYYNLLYKDKDYKGEAGFIHELIQKYSPDSKTILDLGCGTGRHDALWAENGYAVTGVDMSEEMLSIARSQQLDQPTAQPLNFIHGDIRSIRLNLKYDVVISLFHVMSYQTTNDDFVAALHTARAHLKPEGVFIFDFWYGPAVLTDRPAVRVKKLDDEQIQVMRTAEPVMHANKNLVDVNYTVWIKDKKNLQTEEIRETHHMRYWFMPEIAYLLEGARFQLIEISEWMSRKEPGFDTWGVYALALNGKEE